MITVVITIIMIMVIILYSLTWIKANWDPQSSCPESQPWRACADFSCASEASDNPRWTCETVEQPFGGFQKWMIWLMMVNDGSWRLIVIGNNEMEVSSSSWGYRNSWMVDFMEDPSVNGWLWGRWGTPSLGNLHWVSLFAYQTYGHVPWQC